MADEKNNDFSQDDILKILVATDNHLGYGEKDPIIKNDSFVTFEEILQLAVQNQVDMILLGGDLFHDNKPSRKTVHRTLSLFRKYCLGDKESHLEFVSDPAVNFQHCDFKNVNYQDPNYNIAYPVFSVHGNHDDPTGDDSLSAIDVLSTAGLLNHFGKSPSCDKVEVSPVLLKKGLTKLALYGIGAMRDERLHTTFASKKVNMLVPEGEDGEEGHKQWFNVFVIHQNRAKHTRKNYIPEGFLDEFLDLVIWGHEHECLIEPTKTDSADKPFFVSQPGSSVATSLSEGEAKQKQVGLLSVYQKNFKIDPLPLQTVRQFMMDNIVLAETNLKPHEEEKLYHYLTESVEKLISEAENNHTGHKDQPKLPLIRIKVEYSGGYAIINPHRFGQQFVDRVANCKDILLFYRKKTYDKKETAGTRNHELHLSQGGSQGNAVSMEDLISEYLHADGDLQLDVLSERKLAKALNEFVLKEEDDAISELVKYQLKKTQTEITLREEMKEDNIDELIGSVKEVEDNMDENEENEEMEKVMEGTRNNRTTDQGDDGGMGDSDEVESTASKRGRGGGRGSRGGRGAKTAAKTSTRGTRGRGRGRGRGASAATMPDEEPAQKTIKNSFMSTSRNDDELNGSRKSVSRTQRRPIDLVSSDEEDSDPFSFKSTKRSRK